MSSPRRLWLARRAIDLVMLVLLVAGVSKALDITTFAEALRTWSLFPKWTPLLLAPIVPALEIGTALAWLLGLWRRPSLVLAICTLSVFTLVYAVHLALGEAPNCGCLGLIEAFKRFENEAAFILTRNVVLLALLIWGSRIGAARASENQTGQLMTAPVVTS